MFATEIFATVLFSAAILHTFGAKSLAKRGFHLLGEVELVFAYWSGIFLIYLAVVHGPQVTWNYLSDCSFTEPLFILTIVMMSSSRAVIDYTRWGIDRISRRIPIVDPRAGFYLATLILGPLLGSLISEPAAMTVTALLLKHRFFDSNLSTQFKYATLGLLFVNISIGGILTPFAAPPVLMVASHWRWDFSFMFFHFGWKAILAVCLNTGLCTYLLRQELKSLPPARQTRPNLSVPLYLALLHGLFLAAAVFYSHDPKIFIPLLFVFVGLVKVFPKYNDRLKLKESLGVALFLAGLVVLGKPQGWWLRPLIEQLTPTATFWSATLLTAVLDNAALTYLGASVNDLSDAMKYFLVAGAVSGGGLSVIANAPNPAGLAILKSSFGASGVSAGWLLIAAALPTLVACLCLFFL